MANTTISQLSSVSAPLVSTDVFLLTRAGASYKVAASVIQDFLEAANNTWTGTNTFNTNIVLGSGITIDGVDPSTIATTYLALAGGTMTGNITLAGAPSSGLHPATKTYVDTADALKANLASPTLTGTPLAPTAATATSTTQIATTAFVKNVMDALIFNQTVVSAGTKTLAESETGFVLVDYTSTGAVTITLPEISTYTTPKRVMYYIKDTGLTAGTNNIVINCNAADTIDGASSVTISTDGEDLILFNNGATEWYIIAKDTIASATKAGVIELATSAEVLALTDATRAVTPSTLGALLEDRLYKVTTINGATHTLLEAESGIISVTRTSTGACAITVPSAAGLTDASKVIYTIVDAGRNAGTNNITLTPAAGTINGTASYTLSADGASVVLYNNGTNWIAASDTQAAVNESSGYWTQSGTDIYYSTGGVVIGASTTTSALAELSNVASGDSDLIFDSNGTNKFTIGYDYSATDFVISRGGTLGTTNVLAIADDTGHIGFGVAPDATVAHYFKGKSAITHSAYFVNSAGTVLCDMAEAGYVSFGNCPVHIGDTAYPILANTAFQVGGTVHKIGYHSSPLTTSGTNVGFDAAPTGIGADYNIGIRLAPAAGVANYAAQILSGHVDISSSTTTNFILNTGTGTKFGTATSQKLAFYNSTPIVQPGATTDLGTVLSDLGLRASGTAYPITTTGAFNVGAAVIFSGIETIAPGGTTTALSLTKTLHSIAADAGGDIFTLADGTIGQIMTIVGNANMAGTATITPTNLAGGTSVTFNADGDSVILQFVDTQWYVLGGNSYSII